MIQAKRRGAAAVGATCLGLLCAAALLAPSSAQAMMNAHTGQESDAGMGVVHIAVTLDRTDVGGEKKAVWLPINHDNATVETVLNEFLYASEDKTDRFAHEDYELQSLAEVLGGSTYTVAVYRAEAQQPGAEATYTSESIGDASYAGLETGDAVYVTVTE